MSGFFTATTAMRLYTVSGTVQDYAQALDNAAFRAQPTEVAPKEKIVGFVGLGDPLDTDFLFPLKHEQYVALSLRIDERKPSMAAVRMRYAEALKKEEEKNAGKVSRERKKELKEEILLQVTAKADFVPTLIDCVLDQETNRLIVATASEPHALLATELFGRVFGVRIEAVQPEEDVSKLFERIFRETDTLVLPLSNEHVATIHSDDYSVTLQSEEGAEERATVTARASQEAGLKALEQGLFIKRMGIVAEVRERTQSEDEDPVANCLFTLDDGLLVQGLKMPKHERGNEREDDFYLKIGHAFQVAEIVEIMGKTA